MTLRPGSETDYRAGAVNAMDAASDESDRAENEGMPERHVASETTSLERRVLAHERVLQTLIAHMSEADPAILERLDDVFSQPLKRYEQNFTDTDDYAQEFIHEVMRIGRHNRKSNRG